MEIYFSLEKKYNREILYKLIELYYLYNLNLVLWGDINNKIIVKKENYLNVIMFLKDKNNFYWWLYNDDFSVEYSNELPYLIVESYSDEIFMTNYKYLKNYNIKTLSVYIDEIFNVQKIKKFLKNYFNSNKIVYEDKYAIEYEYIKFLFINDEFSIELKSLDYVFILKDTVKKLFIDNFILDEISLLEKL